MELSYEITSTGYVIFKDGRAWMEQPLNNIPYPGATIEESAQNHINQILKDNESPATPSIPVEDQIKAVNDKIDNAIMELSMLIAMGGSTNV